IIFQIDRVPGSFLTQSSVQSCVGNHGEAETGVIHLSHGQADSVNGHGAFGNDIAKNIRGGTYGIPDGIVLPADGLNHTGPVDMAGDNMSAETAAKSHGSLQIDGTAIGKSSQICPAHGLRHDVGSEGV